MIIDVIVLVILLGSALIAFLRGFIGEVLTIAGVIGGTLAGYLLGPVAAPALQKLLENGESSSLFGVVPYDMAANIIAYGVIFLTVVIGISILSSIISKSAKEAGLGILDRSLGVVFGLVRGALIIGLLYLPVYLLIDAETRDGFMADSKTRPALNYTARWMESLLPKDFAKGLEDKAEEKMGDVTQSAREKLMEMDVLGNGNGKPLPEHADDDEAGYTDEQRRVLEQFIEEGWDE